MGPQALGQVPTIVFVFSSPSPPYHPRHQLEMTSTTHRGYQGSPFYSTARHPDPILLFSNKRQTIVPSGGGAPFVPTNPLFPGETSLFLSCFSKVYFSLYSFLLVVSVIAGTEHAALPLLENGCKSTDRNHEDVRDGERLSKRPSTTTGPTETHVKAPQN